MKRVSIGCLLATGVVCAPWTATAGSVSLFGGEGSYSVRVTSVKEARFKTTIKQQYDFSCGSAALATLLTYHYAHPVTEQEVFQAMYDRGDEEKIRRDGFSLLDIKRHLETAGYRAEGLRSPIDLLAEWGVPAIVLITDRGYRHFVVVKGIERDRVLLGDPALGARTMARADFESMWNGILFLIRDRADVANRFFNQRQDWRIRASAPLGVAIDREGLATITAMLRGPTDF
jgi:predicted double-glycine peptidase